MNQPELDRTMERGRRRGRIRKVVVVAPSAFTLGNLFFGFWSIVSSIQGDFAQASWFIILAGVLDVLDGRVARLSNTGTQFGAELDSLADVISFGMAPAVLMYFLEFATAGRFAWVLCFLYVVAVALRLARYNVMTADRPTPRWFTGLPSPAAGMTLAIYYPFSQTEWSAASMAYLDFDRQGIVILLLGLSVLMVSTVQFPRWPRIGFRSARGLLGLSAHLGIIIGAAVGKAAFLFPLGLAYTTFGIVRFTILRLLDRSELKRWRGASTPEPTQEESDQ